MCRSFGFSAVDILKRRADSLCGGAFEGFLELDLSDAEKQTVKKVHLEAVKNAKVFNALQFYIYMSFSFFLYHIALRF